jgi:hypothetical protein
MKHLKSTGVFCFVIGTTGIFEALGNNNEINLKYFFFNRLFYYKIFCDKSKVIRKLIK